jgi:hypothetical protein
MAFSARDVVGLVVPVVVLLISVLVLLGPALGVDVPRLQLALAALAATASVGALLLGGPR